MLRWTVLSLRPMQSEMLFFAGYGNRAASHQYDTKCQHHSRYEYAPVSKHSTHNRRSTDTWYGDEHARCRQYAGSGFGAISAACD